MEITPCTENSPELDVTTESVRDYMLSQQLFCLKEPEKIDLYGELSQPRWKVLNVKVNKCNKDLLSEGQICKTNDEIEAYMSQLQLILYIKTNYIENNDIDDPLK